MERKNKKLQESNVDLQKTIVKLNMSLDNVKAEMKKTFKLELDQLKELVESEKRHSSLIKQNVSKHLNKISYIMLKVC